MYTQEIINKIKELVYEVCKNQKPYMWHNENDVPWDSSGKVYPMTLDELNSIINLLC